MGSQKRGDRTRRASRWLVSAPNEPGHRAMQRAGNGGALQGVADGGRGLLRTQELPGGPPGLSLETAASAQSRAAVLSGLLDQRPSGAGVAAEEGKRRSAAPLTGAANDSDRLPQSGPAATQAADDASSRRFEQALNRTGSVKALRGSVTVGHVVARQSRKDPAFTALSARWGRKLG